MDEDIVERLRRLVRDGAVEPAIARDYSDAADEIDQLRTRAVSREKELATALHAVVQLGEAVQRTRGGKPPT